MQGLIDAASNPFGYAIGSGMGTKKVVKSQQHDA